YKSRLSLSTRSETACPLNPAATRHRRPLRRASWRGHGRRGRAVASSMRCETQCSRGYVVLTLNEAARKLARRDVAELNIAGQAAKQRNASADEDRHAGDDELLNEPGPKESLNCDPAVDIKMMRARGG